MARPGVPVIDLKARLARGAAWLLIGRFAVNTIGFVSTLVLAHLLTPTDFGLVAIATGLLAIVSAVTNLSLSEALIQTEELTDEHLHTAWTLNMARALIISLAFLAIAYPAAAFYKEPRLANVMLLLAGTVFIGGANNPRIALMNKDLVFWQDFAIGAGSKLVGFLTAATAAYLMRSYWALVIGTAAGQLTGLALSYFILPYQPRISWSRARELWSFSIWLTFCEFINTLNWRLDQLLVGRFLSKSALGFYTVGGDLAALPTREATVPIVQALFPGFILVKADSGRLRDAVCSAQSLTFAVAAPLGFGLAMIAHPVVGLVLGARWGTAATVVQFMACLYAMQTLTIAAQPLGLALGQTRALFHRDLLVFLARVPLVVIGLLTGGLVGALCGRIVAGSFHLVLNILFIRRHADVGLGRQLKSIWRSVVALGAMLLSLVALRPFLPNAGTQLQLGLNIASQVVIAGVVYIGVHAALWLTTGRGPGPERRVMEFVQYGLSALRVPQSQQM
jgi:lipopolysaccharide exporter